MKYCSHCGSEVQDDAIYCPNCGALISQSNDNTNANTNVYVKKNNGFAIAGFVCSFFIPLLGWIFGGIGLSKSKQTNKGKNLSIAAIIIASVVFVINLILQIFNYDFLFWVL